MNDFNKGDRVRIVAPRNATHYSHGDIVKVVSADESGLVIDCGNDNQDFVTRDEVELATADVITIDRADLPKVVVNEAGWMKADNNYLAHIDSAKTATLRLIALQYLSAVELLDAREKESAAAEKEASERLRSRQDEMAREVAKNAGWNDWRDGSYNQHTSETQAAIDMLITELTRG
ncbi:hypothetical protein SAMN04489740_2732 [Arthrobacter alpinus]|uniref:Uncharacterized protein n=1 Tax=Arthrobacter alpinus TaxID=656366 RepID=A0A1H5M4V2_9MICC|nr:hypothetical protein [Arthrobacter alpinus]SEE83797.1 hypothetical protein SAMN04489740_2732 [Arthrobacter alpinus]